MLLLRTNRLPEGAGWEYEIKLDGYRAIAFKSSGRVHLRSRNDKDFGGKYAGIVKALSSLPDETVIDGEVVALDEAGRPSFNVLQNYGSSKEQLLYYVFDVVTFQGRDMAGEPLSSRRELLETQILPRLREPIRVSAILDASLSDLIHAVKAQGLEGLVAKRKNSRYESGQRSGHGRRCASIRARNSSSAATRVHPAYSMRWFSATTRMTNCVTLREPAMVSRPHRVTSCSSDSRTWRRQNALS
jgi:bifunctional non-homologous end joining protein LigD